MSIALEVCVDDAEGLAEAIAGGADRIELCAALGLGGLTPSPGLMQLAAGAAVPVMAMIRPRAGGFEWSGAEVAVMEGDIACARDLGLAGVVIGAVLPDGSPDAAVLSRLLRAADGMDVTYHRAVDLAPDPAAAMLILRDLGIGRVLSSGGALRAIDGLDRLAAMQAATPEITVMPGSGVSLATLPAIRAALPGLREIHASCAVSVPANPTLLHFGFAPSDARRTSAPVVADLRAALGQEVGA